MRKRFLKQLQTTPCKKKTNKNLKEETLLKLENSSHPKTKLQKGMRGAGPGSTRLRSPLYPGHPALPWAPPRAWASAGLRKGPLSPCLSHAPADGPRLCRSGTRASCPSKGIEGPHVSCEDTNVSSQVLHFANVQTEPLPTPRMEGSIGKVRTCAA